MTSTNTADLISTPVTAACLDALVAQQLRILGIVDGLGDAQLRAPVLPSGWTPLGMLVHVREATRFWLRQVTLGEPPVAVPADDASESEAGDLFAVPDTVPAGVVRDRFASITADAVAAVRGVPGEAAPRWWPEGLWGEWRLENVAEIVTHLLVETPPTPVTSTSPGSSWTAGCGTTS